MLKYLPQFESIFIDLKGKSEEEIVAIENSLLRTALHLQFLRFLDQIDGKILYSAFIGLDEDYYGNYIQAMIVYTLKNFNLEEEEFEDFITEFPDKVKSTAMTIADRLIQKGKLEGIEQGLEQGMEQGMEKKQVEIVLKSYQNNIEISLIASITDLSEERVREIIEENN